MEKVAPLTVVESRPAYVEPPEDPIPEDHRRFFITWGTSNGTLAENWGNCVDLAVNAEETFYIAMKSFLNPTTDEIVVPSCEWITYTEAQRGTTGFKTPDFEDDGTRPEFHITELAQIVVDSSLAVYLFNIGGGSLNLRQYVTKIEFAEGKARYVNAIGVDRIAY